MRQDLHQAEAPAGPPKPKKGLVRIHRHRIDPLEVPAEVYDGVLAVHRVLPAREGQPSPWLWQITHVPTGLKIGEPFKRKPEVVAVVGRLLAVGAEAWRFGKFGEQGTLAESPGAVRRVVGEMAGELYPSVRR